MTPKTLDHVAVWVADRDAIADFCCRHLGMHVIDRNERFTLVGSNARRGKLTLFAADGPREAVPLVRIGLRVTSLERARAELPGGYGAEFDVGEGLRIRLVEDETDVDYDLDHVALRAEDPARAAEEYRRLGFAAAAPAADGAPRVEVGGAFVELHAGESRSERPLLHHLGLLVDSAEEHIAEAQELGVEIADVVDAPNTYAVFVLGPDAVKIEYVEHKPSFSLT